MSSCCAQKPDHGDHEGHAHKQGRDWMMIVSAALVLPYMLLFIAPDIVNAWQPLEIYTHSVHEFVITTWWGVVIGIICLALLAGIPREFVMSALGNNKGAEGILRAIGAGILLDLCNHGILMIGTKIYQRGASIGQVMAFLIASPWNSISLTFILIAMIGLKLTLLFILLSAVIAFISGMIFDALVARGVLPKNPNAFDMPDGFEFIPEAKKQLKAVQWTPDLIKNLLIGGIKDSGMVVRWLLFGIVLASALRVFLDPATFAEYFGPSLIGMMATIFFATVLEVCSEGSSPIAADLVTRAYAPGNAFAFLMAGVSTDYTEIMVMKDTTKSWKIALFLPLITLPQIILLGILLNL